MADRENRSRLSKLRQAAGALVFDLPIYLPRLWSGRGPNAPHAAWIGIRNRQERLERNPDGPGVRCTWRWTSDLHACQVFPWLARRLSHRALRDWPIAFAECQAKANDIPEVSFVIAHANADRLGQLAWTVRSILAQRGVSVECVIVDQSAQPTAAAVVPETVRVLHRPLPPGSSEWCKSWAFNLGARAANGTWLVFHDGDICSPLDYADQLVQRGSEWDVVSLQRFLFCTGPELSPTPSEEPNTSRFRGIERVRQNWEGGTIAVRRERFFELGGYDEAFVGWGGEDNEFFDRCQALRHLRYGYLPFVHLWHPPQADKHHPGNANISRVLDQRLAISRAERVRELVARPFGNAAGPQPPLPYRADTTTSPQRE